MQRLFAIIGMILIFGVAYLFSKEKKKVDLVSVGCCFVGQIVLAFLLIKTPLWKVVEILSDGMMWIINQSTEGISFVFGGLTDDYVFFIHSLLPIVFISALMGVLSHYNIIQKFIKLVGMIVARTFRIDSLFATNGVANIFLGQSDSLFVTKSYLPKANDSVIFATMVNGMASISATVVGLYVGYGASIEWILVSMPLTTLASFVLCQIVMPTEYNEEMIEVESEKGETFMDTAVMYGMIGFKTVIAVSVSLMIFLSGIYFINNFIGLFFDGITIQSILGIVFYPIAFFMGVPFNEVGEVAQLLGTRFATNEAVAFAMPSFNTLSESTKAITTVALAGFTGIGSIGILSGALSIIAPNKKVGKLGLKALILATFVTILTAMTVALFI